MADSISDPHSRTRKTIAIVLRVLQFSLGVGVAALFLHMVMKTSDGGQQTEMAVPLAFAFMSSFNAIPALVLIFVAREHLINACLDLVSFCGFVTAAVLMRSIGDSYGCVNFLVAPHSVGGLGAPVTRRGDEQANAADCHLLTGAFALIVVSCVVLLANFLRVLYLNNKTKRRGLRRPGSDLEKMVPRVRERKGGIYIERTVSINSNKTEERALQESRVLRFFRLGRVR